MADADLLPPSVYQGLGWGPGGTLTPPPVTGGPDFGGLPPSVVQGMGWAPPPAPAMPDDAAPPGPPPAPTSLPSMGAPPAAAPRPSTASATPDYQVPASAFGGGKQPAAVPGALPAARPPTPARPQTFDQRMNQLDQREADTLAQQQRAIDAGVQAEKGLHAEQGAAYQRYDQQVAANAAERKAENEQWAKIYATNEAKLDADRKQIESWKFNRNKFMDDLGVGGQVSWGIGAVLAGIGNALQGIKGENPVIQMLQQNIHDANEQQMKERDNLVQKLGMDRQTGLDAQAYHATRQAEIDKADGLALTALSKQLEEAAVKSADPMAQARGLKEAADLRAKSDELLKGSIQLRSQHDLQAQQNAIAGGHLAETVRHNKFEENFQVYKENQEADLKAAALLAKQQGKLSEDESKRAIFIPGPNGDPIPARRKNGDLALAAEPGAADAIRRQVAAASTYNALVGQMIKGIKDHGGESGWLKSDDWQKMQTDYKAAVAELHDAYKVTSFREPTIKFFDEMTSAGVDPTSFIRNASAGLRESNQNVQTKLNALLRDGQGYDGPPIRFPDATQEQPPTQTDEERTASRALLNPHRGFDKLPGVLSTEVGNFSPRGQLGPNETIDTRLKQEGEILPSIRQAMQTWGAALNSPDLAIRQHYRAQLEKIANESESPETAALAQKLLAQAMEQQIGETTRTPELVRGADGAPR